MKLSTEQITEIKAFVKSKYVEYHDIQIELVDHLASAIETELEQYPNQDFEKVLISKYKTFGLFGFSDFVNQKATTVDFDTRMKYLRQFFELFKLPKLVYSVLIFTPTYLILSNLQSSQFKYFVLPYFFMIALAATVFF
jgi:hypothetical protein